MQIRNVEDVYPLSPTQQGLLFHSLYARQSDLYVEQLSWRLDGRLDISALEFAWRQVIARHPILRTSFFGDNLEQPLQVVRRRADLMWRRYDWRALSPSERQRRLATRLESSRRQPFVLTKAPLMRMEQFQLEADSHHFIWSYHHLLLDAWSVSLVLAEVFLFYDAYCQRSSLIREPSRPYRDYIVWLQRQDVSQAEDHWRAMLKGFTEPIRLPVERVRGGAHEGAEEYDQQQIGASVANADELRAFAQQHHLTLSTLVQGAWALLLNRYSGQKDVVFGNVVSGRPTSLAGFAQMVGLFINTLPLRVRVMPDEPILTYLQKVQAQQSATQRYEYVSLKQVREWSEVSGGQPLFDSLVVFDNTPIDETLESGHQHFEVREFSRADTLTGYPLMLEVTPKREIALRFVYDGSRYERATLVRMLAHLQTLLAGFAALGAGGALGALPLLTQAERRELLVGRDDTKERYVGDKCLHELFESQAERTPERIAITFEQTTLTYGQLNARANRLAHQLRKMGVGPEARVGICMENSVELIVGLLGILKAGAAYVPLDPAYPKQRLAFMSADAGISVLLAQRRFLENFFEYDGQVLCLDEESTAGDVVRYENPAGETTADNLAYIIYTSGSTGHPKGVQVMHGNVTRLFAATRRLFEFDEQDVWTLFHSYAFDFSVWELFGALLYGGRLVIVPYWQSRSPESFHRLLIEEKVTVLNQTPSAFKRLLKAENIHRGELSLRLVIFGGEALNPQSLVPWFELHGDDMPRLVNMYGITETTVHVTSYNLSERDTQEAAESLIGRALPDLQCYVLDDRMQPVPVGVPGELYVGGAGLARGYLNRSELTAERFVPHPFSRAAGARLYRTGDLARYRTDGELEYLGRVDNQIKIRGFRIEPGEIEAALCTHSEVQEAVVVARESHGERQLFAYLVSREGVLPAAMELRLLLQERLPEYMIPSQFIEVASMPLTSSGKLDRRALCSSNGLHPETEEPLILPRTPVEKMLSEIWSKTLGVERIGVHDNFFALGGDSILSMQVVFRATQAGLRFSPRDIFKYPTISELALLGRAVQPVQAEQESIIGSLPLTPIQHWFFEYHPADPQHYNQSVLLEARQAIDVTLLMKVIEHLSAHHDALRLRFTRVASEWQQFNAGTEKATVFTCADLSELSDGNQDSAIEKEAARLQASLNLSEGPLLRVVLFECGRQRPSRLLLIFHHLMVDGVSWRILLEDIQTAYEQLSRREGVALPAKTTSFKRWAERLSEYAHSEAVQQELSYWLRETWQAVRPLPIDKTEGENTVASASDVQVSLSVEETKALLQDVPSVYHTQINDVLLTALALSFTRWAKARTLLVDLEGYGRQTLFDDVDLSRTVGWFTNLFPVLLESKEIDGPGEALKAIKEQLRAIPNGGINYGLLRYLGTEGESAAAFRALPRAEVIFNYLGQFDQTLPQDALFRLSRGATGPTRSLRSQRTHILEINGGIEEGRLQLVWTYSRNLHDRISIERLAQSFIAELTALIAHCLSPNVGGYTPSDFPLARLTQPSLDRLSIDRRQLEDINALSPMQEGMLFHTVYSPESDVYFEQLSLRLGGSVDAAALERSWQEVVGRHSILRTSFVWENLDEPVQVIRRDVKLPMAQHDWRGLSPREQQEHLEKLLRSDRSRGFDLSEAPLMRLTLVRVAEQQYFFIWSHHHIVLDGWSVTLLLKEVFLIYEALSEGRPAPPARRRPYGDYIGWLKQQDLSKAEAFWRKTLKGFTTPTPLVGESALRSSADRHTISDHQQVNLSAALTGALADFARAHHLTLNTLVQGAWALLLSRYSGESDIAFGVTVAGRPTDIPGVEETLGLFINTLPVRVGLPREDRLIPWLKTIQDQQTELIRYVYSPLARVQGWSEVQSGTPLFRSILVFENYPTVSSLPQTSAGLKIDNIHKPESTDYPLMLVAVPGTELSMKLLFDSRCFDRTTITRMLGHLRSLLAGMLDSGEQRLVELPLLSEGELHEALIAWNDTQAAYPAESCFHRLFESQVRRTPDACAVVFKDQSFSYDQLNRLANQLAHRLRSLKVGPEMRVGVLLPRSAELLVALLAIFKAGAAFVPLDPAYPQERLTFLLKDAALSALITREQLLECISEREAPTLCLDADWKAIELESEQNPIAEQPPISLAYVLYTSGSTGIPKGVMIEHRSLVNHLCWVNENLLGEAVRMLPAVTNLTFDAALKQLLAPLLRGNTVRIWDADLIGDPAAFTNELSEHADVGINCVPSLWRATLDTLQSGDVAAPRGNLKRLYLGGEKLDPELIERTFSVLPDLHVWNLYGPTETAAVASAALLMRGEAISIGRPLSNMQVYVLDKELRPVPIGAAGEIYIGGAGVARGYLNRPDLTAEKFTPHPFSCEPGARLYRTGDIARYLPDGTVEYLGRSDQQTKLRGYRIEPGEIETILKQHSDIKEAIVHVFDTDSKSKQLIAYVVPQQRTAPSLSELRSLVKAKLPPYMVPSRFVVLDAMPLMDNGKIDRRALPLPYLHDAQEERIFVGPRTPEEEILANIWSEVLSVRQVGVHDDFFESGGDSILSIRIIARARQEGIKVTPRQLFEHPTIAELVECLSSAAQGQGARSVLPLTPAQRYLLEQSGADPKHPSRVILLEGQLSREGLPLVRVIRQLLVHHDALRLRFDMDSGGVWWQSDAGAASSVPLTELDLSGLTRAGQEISLQEIIAKPPLGFADGLPIRVIVCHRGAGIPSLLLLIIHRLAADTASCQIILEDLQTACHQLSKGEAIRLPRQTASFRQWAERVKDHAALSSLEQHEVLWLNELPERAPRLPVDFPEVPKRHISARTLSVLLTAEETGALVNNVRAAYRAVIEEVLLTALLQGLAKWTGRRRWLIAVGDDGRDVNPLDLNLARTVGCLSAFAPVWLSLSETGLLGESLKLVKERLGRVPYRGLGYGVSRYSDKNSELARKLRQLPQAEISFARDDEITRAGLDSSLLRPSTEFDWARDSLPELHTYLLNVSWKIVGHQMQLSWTYNENLHRHSSINRLAESTREAVRSLIIHVRASKAGALTPSDFPDADLSQRELDLLLKGLGKNQNAD